MASRFAALIISSKDEAMIKRSKEIADEADRLY
jgi:hypothetical protein